MQIEEYRRRLEEFTERLNREQYTHYSGQKDTLEIGVVYSEYSDLFTLESIREIQAEIDRTPASQDSRRQSLHKLHSFAIEHHLEQRCHQQTEEIADFESRFSFHWQGKDFSFAQMSGLLANEPDAGRRRRLYEFRTKALLESNALRRERLTALHSGAQRLGYSSYLDACSACTGIDYEALAATLERTMSAIESAYLDRMNRSVTRLLGLNLREVHRADTGFWIRRRDYDPFFPKDGLLPAVYATLAGLGIDPDRQPGVSLDLEERPVKHPRAFCAPIRIPQEIKVVLSPRGGQDDYVALLHETGHAQHFAGSSPNLAAEHRICGDRGLSEVYAFLFEHLMWDPRWLEANARITRPDEFLGFQSLVRAHMVRRYSAKLRYEILLHGADGPGNAATAYAEFLGKSTGMTYDEESYLEDLDDNLYAADYLRAWIFEAQLREYLRTKFGNRWFQSAAAGRFLKEIWETGQLYRIEDLSREIGLGELQVELIHDELRKGLRE